MNEIRRTLLKGMLTGAFIGTVGLPRQSFAAYPVVLAPMTLLLTGTPMDAMFLTGTEAAAVESGQRMQTVVAVQRAGILDPVGLRDFLQAHRGTRVVGLMDDANYVLFSAMAHDAGGTFLAEGLHGQYAQAVSRHELRVATGLRGAADVLAAGLARGGDSFSVTELPFAVSSALPGRDWSALGFDTYRVGREQPFCLHLAGLPLASACAALDVSSASVELVASVLGRPKDVSLKGEWPTLLGYALCHADGEARAHTATQMFLRGDAILNQHEKHASVASFVIDL